MEDSFPGSSLDLSPPRSNTPGETGNSFLDCSRVLWNLLFLFHHQDDNKSSPPFSFINSQFNGNRSIIISYIKGAVLLTGKKNTRNKPCVPRLKSAAYAIMITLYRYDFFRVGVGGYLA